MAQKTEVTVARHLIFEKIPAIMHEVSAIEKSRRNPTQGYAFRGIDDMYNELHGLFAKHRVFFTSRVLRAEREERLNRSGSPLVYSIIDIEFTFFAEDGSSVSSVMRGEAMDSGDKASSKAASSALKYALMQLFMIPTVEEKDIEYHSHELAVPRATEKAEAQEVAPNGVTDGQPSATVERREPDTRPWLTEMQLNAMLEAIGQGKGGVVMGKMDSYKIRRDFRERLNSALAGSKAQVA